jgi:hypothetical protein
MMSRYTGKQREGTEAKGGMYRLYYVSTLSLTI